MARSLVGEDSAPLRRPTPSLCVTLIQGRAPSLSPLPLSAFLRPFPVGASPSPRPVYPDCFLESNWHFYSQT